MQRYEVPGMVPVEVEGNHDYALRGFGYDLLISEEGGGKHSFELLKLDEKDPYYAETVAASDDWDVIVAELKKRAA